MAARLMLLQAFFIFCVEIDQQSFHEGSGAGVHDGLGASLGADPDLQRSEATADVPSVGPQSADPCKAVQGLTANVVTRRLPPSVVSKPIRLPASKSVSLSSQLLADNIHHR